MRIFTAPLAADRRAALAGGSNAAVAAHQAERRRRRMRAQVLAPKARWTHMAKLDLVMAIKGGEVSVDEAIAAHGLGFDELAGWRDAVARFGPEGLKITKRPRRAA